MRVNEPFVTPVSASFSATALLLPDPEMHFSGLPHSGSSNTMFASRSQLRELESK